MQQDEHETSERQQREERMRYEVLLMLYRAAGGIPEEVVNAWSFSTDLGVWRAEVFRVIEWLERQGLVRYHGAGPAVSITPAGAAYLESHSNRRSTLRESDPFS
jgi:DNA-binding IclR family transcriptional regulator